MEIKKIKKVFQGIIFAILPKLCYDLYQKYRVLRNDRRERKKSNKRLQDPILKNNLELKDIAKGKRVFFLATGPSIKKQDLTKLAGEDCFSVSNFFLHKDIGIIKPKLHFFAPYHKPLILENFIDWMRLADEKLPAETNMVLGLSNKYLVEEYNLFPHRKIYYLDFSGSQLECCDLEKPILGPMTGWYAFFPLAEYMGYDEINLIGCDMSMLKNYAQKTENFYDKDPRKNATDAHVWGDVITELEVIVAAFKVCLSYKNNLIAKGKSINNLSPDSWLSFINRIDYDEYFITKI